MVRLAQGYPDTKAVTKDEITAFVRGFYPKVGDVQQARHLGMQEGYNIVSGTRGDGNDIPPGSYKLLTLESTHPAFKPHRREGFAGDWNEIKARYNYRCAECGSKEGEEHLFRKGVIVELQKGHMDPTKPLTEGNIIPQCQVCNRADRSRWIYDKTGRVVEIADTNEGLGIVKRFINRAKSTTLDRLYTLIKSLHDKIKTP